MFEVGKTYTTPDGVDRLCIIILSGNAYLVSHQGATAYVWLMDGTSVSLGDGYHITPPDPRDQEIADLKTRVAVLTAIVQADEYTIPVADNAIWYDHTDDSIHVRRVQAQSC